MNEEHTLTFSKEEIKKLLEEKYNLQIKDVTASKGGVRAYLKIRWYYVKKENSMLLVWRIGGI